MQARQIWHPNWVRLAPNGTNLGLFKISFSTFWLGEPKCTETDLKKSQNCPIWGQSDSIWMTNLPSLQRGQQLNRLQMAWLPVSRDGSGGGISGGVFPPYQPCQHCRLSAWAELVSSQVIIDYFLCDVTVRLNCIGVMTNNVINNVKSRLYSFYLIRNSQYVFG